jgi:hypothetical protein
MRREVDRRVLASSVDFDVEFDPVALVEFAHARTLDRTDVHERVRLAVITGDEAEALHGVEELDRPGRLLTGQLAAFVLFISAIYMLTMPLLLTSRLAKAYSILDLRRRSRSAV